MDNDKYILWLLSISLRNPHKFLKYCKSAKNIFEGSDCLNKIPYISKETVAKIKSFANNEYLVRVLDNLKQSQNEKGIKFISYKNPLFPKRFNNIENPPLGIFVKGELPKEHVPSVAIIGSRETSQYGAKAAFNLAKEMAGVGINIISGMARGADANAHMGALDAQGYTVAVLGCGIDICYPPQNFGLYKDIWQHGCFISEYMPKSPATKWNFPARNRLISALCDALLVVEAGEKSGTSITVGFALDMGKEVFVVPGSIFNPKSVGTNKLIQDGATPIMTYLDIINYFKHQKSFELFFNENNKSDMLTTRPQVVLNKDEKIVYSCISYEPISIDNIIYNSGISIEKINKILFELELKGLVEKQAGARYIKNK